MLVLADNAGHEHLRVRQGDVRERLARLRQQVRLLHLEGLQVHHRKHAVHHFPRAVAWRDVIVVLNDVGPVAYADELRIVCTLHLSRRHADKPGEHLVGRSLGIPACRQELRGLRRPAGCARGEGPADEHLQLRFRSGELLGQHVGFGEPREQDLAIGGPVAVIGDEDRAVRGLKAVGIGHACALVEHESALPGLAVVVGQPGAQLHAALVGVHLVAVLHEQQPARGQPANVEAGVGLADARRLRGLGPGAATVGRGRLHDALRRPSEHPERLVSPLHDHVFMPVGIGKPHRGPPLPGRPLVRRNEHIRAAEGVELRKQPLERAVTGALVE